MSWKSAILTLRRDHLNRRQHRRPPSTSGTDTAIKEGLRDGIIERAVLVGAWIMSITLAALLKCLDPSEAVSATHMRTGHGRGAMAL